ncbi:CU044_2847 family protein [Nonomuraea sp. NPDC050404]|uniref:CU044_2847 family protein n=1 Tax=Nonomuraea sp. NPDC050404 TaxID=3155783 RepID=UPI00340F4CED
MDGTIRDAADGGEILVPVTVDGQLVYLTARSASSFAGPGQEEEIAARRPTLQQVLDGLTGIARALGAQLRKTEADKVTVEFGCEFALESGSFVAVIGKASAKSTFKVGLEWSRPAP